MTNLSLKPVFFHKIGHFKEGSTLTYKVFFASTDPLFYFVAYVEPTDTEYSINFAPMLPNTDNFSVVELGDSSRTYKFGEEFETVVANRLLEGFGDYVTITLSIEKPFVFSNSAPGIAPTGEHISEYTRTLLKPLYKIGLFQLASSIAIGTQARMTTMLSLANGFDFKKAIEVSVTDLLIVKKNLSDAIDKTLPSKEQEWIKSFFLKILNASPYTSSVAQIFCDIVSLSRMMAEKEIRLSDVPYQIAVSLVLDWIKKPSRERENKLKQVSENKEQRFEFRLNASSMEKKEKLYEALNNLQSFIYITGIEVKNIETGESKHLSVQNQLASLLSKNKSSCLETRGLQTKNGRFIVQYGYGTSCDTFIGMYALIDGDMYGLKKESKIVNDSLTPIRTWSWKDQTKQMIGSTVDSADNIQVTFKGI